MAKTLYDRSTEFDRTTLLRTLNALQQGDKILFIDGALINGRKAIAHVDGNDYANGTCCVVATKYRLRAFMLSQSCFIARNNEPVTINGIQTEYPQCTHVVSDRIATLGDTAIDELIADKKVVAIGATYRLTCDYSANSAKAGQTYRWTTLGVDETDETYTIEDNAVKYGDFSLPLSDIIDFFDEFLPDRA